jgi:hypothetical protein
MRLDILIQEHLADILSHIPHLNHFDVMLLSFKSGNEVLCGY